jgi:hypothetical protein
MQQHPLCALLHRLPIHAAAAAAAAAVTVAAAAAVCVELQKKQSNIQDRMGLLQVSC